MGMTSRRDSIVCEWAPRFSAAFNYYEKVNPGCKFHPSIWPRDPNSRLDSFRYVSRIVDLCVWSGADPVPVLQTWLHVMCALPSICYAQCVAEVLPKGVMFDYGNHNRGENGAILHAALLAWIEHLPYKPSDQEYKSVLDAWERYGGGREA